MTKRHLLVVGLISVLMLLLAGCTTSFEEWSGNMSNETGRHVKAYDENQPDDNSQAIQPTLWLGAMTIDAVKAQVREIQSVWNTSSISAHHSPSARVGTGSCMGSIMAHHSCVFGSAAIFCISASKSSPTYSK